MTNLSPNPSAFDMLQTYNGMDTIATEELYRTLLPLLDTQRAAIYHRSLALQPAAIEMMLTGLRLNIHELQKVIARLEEEEKHLVESFTYITTELGAPEIKINSSKGPKSLAYFFYTHLGYPEISIFDRSKNVSRVSTNDEALQKLVKDYPETTPLVQIILAYRVIQTRFRVYRSGYQADKRMRSSYSVAGTETGRWSSSKTAWHDGTNLQNIPADARHIFTADEGKKLAYIDLEQAESRLTALHGFAVTGQTNYLDACISGDLHTQVAKLVWKNGEIPWTGDPIQDRELAERPFYRDYDYRFMCKKIGHGSNYYGKPPALAKQARVPVELVSSFQTAYFKAFPEIPAYHRSVIRDLQLNKKLVTFLGRVRHFFGRTNDDATIREAIAFMPQSEVADIINEIIIILWRANIVQILAQIHDAILIQYPEELENQILNQVLKLIPVPITATHEPSGKTVTHIVPNTVEVGWNFGKFDKNKNPDGLRKWKGDDDRRRKYNPEMHFLDRPVR